MAGRPRLGSLGRGAAALAPALGLGLFVAGLALRPMEETDLFFRLAVGERILATGQLPRRNLFSFTHPEHPDLDSAWLFDAGAALLQRAGGFPAVVATKALLLALTFAGAWLLCRRRGAGPLAAGASLAAAALVMADRFVERPHLFSFAGLVALQAVLLAAERRPRLLWLLPAITAVWVNLHAGAFLAPALLAAAAAGAALDRRRGEPSAASPALLLAAAGACAAALLISPVGAGLFRYLAVHADIQALHPVDEFRAPSWRSDAPLLLLAAATGLAVALVRIPGGRRWRELLPVAALAALAVHSVRFGAELTLLAAPLLAVRLSGLAARLRPRAIGPDAAQGPAAGAPAAGAPAVRAPAGSPWPPLLLGAALTAAALAPRLAARAAGRPALDLDLAREALPLDALAFVEASGLRGRMYNDFELGGYLAWTGYPRHRVFTDPRLPAYPRSFHQMMGRGDLSRAEWDRVMDSYRVDSALLGYAGINRRVAWWDPARWALVYRQGDARVFARRLPRHAPLIAAREIPATFSFTAEAGTRTLALPAPPAGSPVPACEWQRRLGDLLRDLQAGDPAPALAAYRRALAGPAGCLDPARAGEAQAWVGATLLARGDPAGALAALDAALALRPTDGDLLSRRALALERLGRRSEARAGWLRTAAVTVDPSLADRARARAARLGP
jgi:tetratricopeptide (TPR) repeat protein